MESLWKRYAVTQLNPNNAFEETHPEVVPHSRVEEIHAWEDWAMENYAEAIEVA
jgi:hypothetical protein